MHQRSLAHMGWRNIPFTVFSHLALGEGSSTSVCNFPGIGGVHKLFEVGILEVLAEAGFLFLDLTTADCRWCTGRCDCTHTRAQLCGVACYCHCYMCFSKEQQQQSAEYCNVWCLHFSLTWGKLKMCVCVRMCLREREGGRCRERLKGVWCIWLGFPLNL